MSKTWSEKNNSTVPKDIKTQDENFAHRNAMGTGPFVLKEWQPDQKMVLSRNPAWWGKSDGNVTEVIYTPVRNVSTRMAALLSGAVDLVLDPSPQDLGRIRSSSEFKVVDGVKTAPYFLAWTSSATSCLVAMSRAKIR
jgi:peptide/nickel transport system substrate-binding protein